MTRLQSAGLALALAPIVWMAPMDAEAADVFDGPTVTVVPAGAVVGDGKTSVTLQVFAREADGTPLDGLKGKVRASEGSVGSLKALGEGWYAFDFTPPSTTQPIEVTVSLDAGARSSELKVPVVPRGAGSLTIAPNPPSMVLGREDGVSVSFAIDGDLPGTDLELYASSGELSDLTDMGGGSWTARYTAPAVNYPHLAILSAVSRNHPELSAVAVVKLQGAVDFPVTAPAGSTVVLRIADRDYGPVKMDAAGKGKVPIIVSPGVNEARKIVVQDGNRDESPFDLKIPETRRIAFIPFAGGIPATGEPQAVRVAVRKPDGSPEGGAKLTVTASKGTVGSPRHLGDGVYEVDFTPSGAGPVTLEARLPGSDKNTTTLEATVMPALPESVAWDALDGIPTAPDGSGVAAVVVVPKSRVLVGDAETTLFVAAVDRFGYPVPNQTVTLKASSGTVTGSVKTGATGVATATLSAPKATGGVRVTGTTGEWTTRTGLVAAKGAVEAVWPRSEGAQGAWEMRLPTDTPEAGAVAAADPDGTEPAVETPEPDAPEPAVAEGDADVASVIVTLPKAIAPGSKATITARALTADGLGVAGETMDFLTNAGTFGPVEDDGKGTYTSTLTIPKKASGELKVSVVAESGAMARETLPIDPGAITAVVTPKPRPDKPKAEKGDLPFLRTRVGAAFGSYAYAQRPTETPGPLLPGSLIVGGSEGGRAAPVGGIELDSRAWFIDYVGVHVGFRAGRYTITADTFSADAPDWLYHFRANLTGRYPIAFGSNHLWFGASAGFQIDDFIVFKGDCLQAGCTVEYEPLALPGFEVGGEVGLEVGRIHGVTNLSRGLAFGTVGYRTSWDLDVGVTIIENLYADVGLSVIGRRLDVEGDTTGTPFGELSDTQTVGRLSLGFQL
jgi:hypothetical protein